VHEAPAEADVWEISDEVPTPPAASVDPRVVDPRAWALFESQPPAPPAHYQQRMVPAAELDALPDALAHAIIAPTPGAVRNPTGRAVTPPAAPVRAQTP